MYPDLSSLLSSFVLPHILFLLPFVIAILLLPFEVIFPPPIKFKFFLIHNLLFKIDFWDSVYGFNMRVIKDIALSEPLVDLVESKAVVTNAAPILTLDIMTCKKEVRGVVCVSVFVCFCVYMCV